MSKVINEKIGQAESGAHELKNKIQGAERQLEKMSRDAGEKIGEVASDLAEKSTEYVKTSRKYVKENPGKSVAMAAAAGAVAGSILTLAMRRPKKSN